MTWFDMMMLAAFFIGFACMGFGVGFIAGFVANEARRNGIDGGTE